ncbi:MAG: hydrolase [Clostridia bacterium]|nr:hydrolase [Clostridia bacterium]
MKPKIPEYESRLRHNIIKVPGEARRASGISVFGKRLKTFIFSTDIAIIRNCDADAVFAVYPFTPQVAISESIIKGAYSPVFCGVGGGTTQGVRTVALAKDVEAQGACGVVLNAPVSDLNIFAVAKAVDVPVVITVVSEDTDIKARLDAGAAILNVAAADKTPSLVRKIRERFPDVPIIATGGPTPESIAATVEAGANAISYTPPSAKTLFSALMGKYRE